MAAQFQPVRRQPPSGDAEDTHPTPVRWIFLWPWSQWDSWQRTAVVGHLVSKTVVGLAALFSAVVLVLGLGPQAYQTVFWREEQYAILRELHAGNSLDYLEQRLGKPAFVKPAGQGKLPYTQHIFERRDHVVMAVTNQTNEVVLLSVLSCSPDFAPTFESPIGNQVRLQAVPLSEAITGPTPGAWGTDSTRRVSYVPGVSVSSMEQFVEEGVGASNASRGRAFYVGVNGICTDLNSLGLGQETYTGKLSSAPDTVTRARTTIAANFYAETVDLEASLQNNAQLIVTAFGDRYGGLPVSPFHFDLPLSFRDRAGTRRF